MGEKNTWLTAKADFLDFVNRRRPSTRQIRRFFEAQVDAGAEIVSTSVKTRGDNELRRVLQRKGQEVAFT
jgi:hypothetical protein